MKTAAVMTAQRHVLKRSSAITHRINATIVVELGSIVVRVVQCLWRLPCKPQCRLQFQSLPQCRRRYPSRYPLRSYSQSRLQCCNLVAYLLDTQSASTFAIPTVQTLASVDPTVPIKILQTSLTGSLPPLGPADLCRQLKELTFRFLPTVGY